MYTFSHKWMLSYPTSSHTCSSYGKPGGGCILLQSSVTVGGVQPFWDPNLWSWISTDRYKRKTKGWYGRFSPMIILLLCVLTCPSRPRSLASPPRGPCTLLVPLMPPEGVWKCPLWLFGAPNSSWGTPLMAETTSSVDIHKLTCFNINNTLQPWWIHPSP